MNIKRVLKSWQSYEEQKSLFDKVKQTATEILCNSLEQCKTEGCILEDNLQHVKDFTYVMKAATTGSMPIKPEDSTIVIPLTGYRYCHAQGYLTDEIDKKRTLHRWGTITYVPRGWEWFYIIEVKLTPSETEHIRNLDTLEKDNYLKLAKLNGKLWSETKERASLVFSISGLEEFARFLKTVKKP